MNDTILRLGLRYGETVSIIKQTKGPINFTNGTRQIQNIQTTLAKNTLVVTRNTDRYILEMLNSAFSKNNVTEKTTVYFVFTPNTKISLGDKVQTSKGLFEITCIENKYGIYAEAKTCT